MQTKIVNEEHMGAAEKLNRETVVRLKRTSKGLRVQARSPLFHAYFASKTVEGEKKTTKSTKWGGLEFFLSPSLPVISEVEFDKIGAPLYLEGYVVNLSFLRAVGLDKGVEFYDVDRVLGDVQMRNLQKGISSGMQRFFEQYFRPLTLTTKFVVEELEESE